MRPGDTITLMSTCESAAGVAQTGVGGAYAFATFKDGVAAGLAVTTTEIASGRYKHAIVLPSSKGVVAIYGTNGSNVVWPAEWEFVLENQDLDSAYALAARPVINGSATGAPAVDTPLLFDAKRYHDCSATRVDQLGVAVDLSGYNNFRFTVWDKLHSGGSALYALSSGITGSAGGVVAWSVPEGAAFFSQIDAAIAAGTDPVTLYYDIVADKAADSTKSVRILGGPLTLRRYEGAA